MFYDQYVMLCKNVGEKPYSLAKKLGIKSSTTIVGQWKKGSVPRQSTLQMIADYFNVSIDYLLTGEEKQPTDPDGLSEKNQRLIEWFRSLPPEKQKAILTLQGGPEDVL